MIDPVVKKILITLWGRSKFLSEELQSVILGEKKDRSFMVKKQFVQICCVFNLLSKFIKDVIEISKFQ